MIDFIKHYTAYIWLAITWHWEYRKWIPHYITHGYSYNPRARFVLPWNFNQKAYVRLRNYELLINTMKKRYTYRQYKFTPIAPHQSNRASMKHSTFWTTPSGPINLHLLKQLNNNKG